MSSKKYSKEETRDQLLRFMAREGIEGGAVHSRMKFYKYFIDSLPEEERSKYYQRITMFPDIKDYGGVKYFFGELKSPEELGRLGQDPWPFSSNTKYNAKKVGEKLLSFIKEKGMDPLSIMERAKFYEEEFLPSLSKEERKHFHKAIKSIPGIDSSDFLFGGPKKNKYSPSETIDMIWEAINSGAKISDNDSFRAWRETLPEEKKNKMIYSPSLSFSMPNFFGQFRSGRGFYGLDEHIELIEKNGLSDLDCYQSFIEEENKKGVKKYHFDPEKIFNHKLFIPGELVASNTELQEVIISYAKSQVLINELLSLNTEIGSKLEEAIGSLDELQDEISKLKRIKRVLEQESVKYRESSLRWKRLAGERKSNSDKYEEITRRVALRRIFEKDSPETKEADQVRSLYYSREYTRALPSRMQTNNNFISFNDSYFYAEKEIEMFISKNGIIDYDEYLLFRDDLPVKARKFYPEDLKEVYKRDFFKQV